MSEIIRNSTGIGVTLDLNATNVSAKIGRDLENLQAGMVAAPDPAPPYYWAVQVPYSITRLDGDFYVEWTYTIDGDEYVRLDVHTVVTPLVLPHEIVDTYVAGGISQELYDELEPLVRNFIQGICDQTFGYTEETKIVLGDGLNYLDLRFRLARLNSISYNSATYTKDGFVVVMDGWRLARKPGTILEIKEAPPEGPVVNGVIVSPYGTANMIFRDNMEYAVDGGWGYPAVPDQVKSAAKLIFGDWACQDAAYRNKYLANFRAADWRVQFKEQAFLGTGNLTADKLLERYIHHPWEII